MANNANTLRSFLISLSYAVNEQSQRKFASSIAVQTAAAEQLAEAMKDVAGRVIHFVQTTVEGFNQLYFSSQRTKSSADNLVTFGRAADRAGASSKSWASAVETVAQKIRELGQVRAGQWFSNLGIQATDANGQLLDTSNLVENILKRMQQLRASGRDYLATQIGNMTGIPADLQTADLDKLIRKQKEYQAVLKMLGLSEQEAANNAVTFSDATDKIKFIFQALTDKFGAKLSAQLLPALNKFSNWLTANSGKIGQTIDEIVQAFEPFIAVMAKVGAVVLGVLKALLDWFTSLSPATQKVVAAIVLLTGSVAALVTVLGVIIPIFQALWSGISGVITVIKLLGSAIVASNPELWVVIGIITALVAIYAKWHDQINAFVQTIWSVLSPAVKALGSMIKEHLIDTAKDFGDVFQAIGDAIHGNITGAISHLRNIWHRASEQSKKDGDTMVGAFNKVKNAANNFGNTYNSIRARQNAGSASVSSPLTGSLARVRGIRNNNPGNLNFAGQAGATLESGPGGRFAVFASAQQGLDALARQLELYAGRGIDTVRGIISKFAPPGENNTAAYIARITKALGVSATQHLNLGDQGILTRLMSAVIGVENGGNPYSTDMLRLAAAHAGVGSAPVQITQHNTTTITGASDPNATASALNRVQADNNSRLVRNLQRRHA